MRAFPLLLALFAAPALGAPQNWEVCLDRANFRFTVDGFVSSSTVQKDRCQVQIALSGGKGEKFGINLCDPLIHIEYFPSIESDSSRRVLAGNAGCPAPLFGADFETNAAAWKDFRYLRDRVLSVWAKVKDTYGEGADQVNLSDPRSFSPEVSAGKIACGDYLLREYLQKCMAFEGGPADAKPAVNTPEAGVHPQTILPPKR